MVTRLHNNVLITALPQLPNLNLCYTPWLDEKTELYFLLCGPSVPGCHEFHSFPYSSSFPTLTVSSRSSLTWVDFYSEHAIDSSIKHPANSERFFLVRVNVWHIELYSFSLLKSMQVDYIFFNHEYDETFGQKPVLKRFQSEIQNQFAGTKIGFYQILFQCSNSLLSSQNCLFIAVCLFILSYDLSLSYPQTNMTFSQYSTQQSVHPLLIQVSAIFTHSNRLKP